MTLVLSIIMNVCLVFACVLATLCWWATTTERNELLDLVDDLPARDRKTGRFTKRGK